MFLLMGISQGRKELEHNQTVICDHCGAYGRYQLYMIYNCLTLFFIPIIKWNKRYYVQMSCCGTVYELYTEIGDEIARGHDVEILPEDLTRVQSGRGRYRRCSNCGYSTQEDFDYCPKCGLRM